MKRVAILLTFLLLAAAHAWAVDSTSFDPTAYNLVAAEPQGGNETGGDVSGPVGGIAIAPERDAWSEPQAITLSDDYVIDGIPERPVVGQKYRFGTLRVGGYPQKNPTRPWPADWDDDYGPGNIPAYSSGPIMLGDSGYDPAFRVTWVYAGEGRFIADRNLLANVSWDDLNGCGLITGAETFIDGQRFTARSVKSAKGGGSSAPAAGLCEWDDVITGVAGAVGLPKYARTDIGSSGSAAPNYTGQANYHNRKWNWYKCLSWAYMADEMDGAAPSSYWYATRGDYAPYGNYFKLPTARALNIGFRPALVSGDTRGLNDVRVAETQETLSGDGSHGGDGVVNGLPVEPVIGQKYRFGTLLVNGQAQKNPTKPWRTDDATTSLYGPGNIPEYGGGPIAIGDSVQKAAQLITWVYVGGGRYIADRNILVNVPWETLEDNNLASGQTVAIDGQSFHLRSVADDWDAFIGGQTPVRGLAQPTAADLDSDLARTDFVGAHNRFWNWAGCYSYTLVDGPAGMGLAGYDGPLSHPGRNLPASEGYQYIGYRPVLE